MLARAHATASACALLLLPGLCRAAAALGVADASLEATANVDEERGALPEDTPEFAAVSPSYGPPGETPGIPSDAALEADGAVIGKVVIDNQNIFDPNDPTDATKNFRLAAR